MITSVMFVLKSAVKLTLSAILTLQAQAAPQLEELRSADELAFSCSEPLAAAEEAKLLDGIDSSYRGVSDLKANFSQESYFFGLDQRKRSQGEVFFKKPGKMDWHYQSPDEQRFIADGKTLWFFQPDLNQVTLGDFDESFQSDLPVSFLLGVGQLKESFRLKSACVTSAGVLASFSAVADDNLDNLNLLVRKNDKFPIGAKIVDIGGNETTILFREIATNNKLADSRFGFSVPDGVDVIDNRGATKDE